MININDEIEAGLTSQSNDKRISWAENLEFVPTGEQIKRGLLDIDMHVRAAFMRREDWKISHEQIDLYLLDITRLSMMRRKDVMLNTSQISMMRKYDNEFNSGSGLDLINIELDRHQAMWESNKLKEMCGIGNKKKVVQAL